MTGRVMPDMPDFAAIKAALHGPRMTPERVANVVKALQRQVEGNSAARERLRRACVVAKDNYALMAAQGTIPVGSAVLMAANSSGLDLTPELVGYFRGIVEPAVVAYEAEMEEAAWEVCYQTSWLLDARASAERIAAAARAVSGPLAQGEVDAIVAREKAWWVRLHVALDAEAAHAA